jgi:alpha-tubulin suppressor-like RCC1 family protein
VNVFGAGQATLAAGGYPHTCALTSAGGVKCWGNNSFGQLGDGTTLDRTTPVDVIGLTSGVVAVTASCALTSLGAVKCWGPNFHGQVGDGTRQHRTTPTQVAGLSSGVVAISGRGGHTCALTIAGRLLCWGYGATGQLGTGGTTDRYWPFEVDDPGTVYTAVTTGGAHTCGLTRAGAVKCWGVNLHGQIGDRTTEIRLRPVQAFGLSRGVAAVIAGDNHTCAIAASGGLKCWGYNQYGAVGDGNAYDRWMPAQVVGLESGVVAVVAGRAHTCALLSSGRLSCWGYNYYGQLGDGTRINRYTPFTIPNIGGYVVSLAGGLEHTCALLSPSRALRCWGNNEYGQLGNGATTARQLLPVTTTGFWGLLRGRALLARTLAAGAHPLQATYSGSADHAASTSNVVQHRVQ